MKFSEISGQDRVKKMLLGAIGNGRVANAYLFIGQEMSDLKCAALSFASALNCSSPSGDSCGVCQDCRKIDKGIHPDVFILEPDGSTIKIDQVREMISYTRFGPTEAGYKVCIIDDARAMTIEAANSFLKTLEEPLSNVVFILLSGSEVGLPQTILSRCQKVVFNEPMDDALGGDEEIILQAEWMLRELGSARKGDVAKLLEISSKVDGERLDEKLACLGRLFWGGGAMSLDAEKAVISALSAVKKRANKKLALDVMFLRLGGIAHVR